jgi:hypothetical protein
MAIDWGLVLGAAGVVGIPAAVGLTMGATTRGEFRFVRACFIVAGLLTLASLAWLTYEHPLGLGKILVAAVVGAAVAVGLVVALEWVSNKESAALSKSPEPVSEPKTSALPPKYSGEIAPIEKLIFASGGPSPKIQIGTSGVFFANGAGQFETYLSPVLRRDQFKIETIDGQIKVSTRVADSAGNLTAEIIRNEWKVLPPPGTWDRNYNDTSLEVKDPKGHIVLQVRIVPNAVQIQGAWPLGPEWKPTGVEYVIVRADPAGKGAQFVLHPFHPAPGVEWPEIKPLFEYPSERHLGELAKQ